jgi:hypothetical protein
MYRALSVVALTLVVGCTSGVSNRPDTSQGAPRIVKQTDLPLVAGGETSDAKGRTRSFRERSTRGWINASGDWSLTTEVSHTRLRCGTYQAGIQIGRGNASCTDVQWLTNTELATVIHSSSGRFQLAPVAIRSANCVRVVVRCTGAC